jgi:hypothetical protein
MVKVYTTLDEVLAYGNENIIGELVNITGSLTIEKLCEPDSEIRKLGFDAYFGGKLFIADCEEDMQDEYIKQGITPVEDGGILGTTEICEILGDEWLYIVDITNDAGGNAIYIKKELVENNVLVQKELSRYKM